MENNSSLSGRDRVLHELENRGPMTLADLVAIAGLHENTVRGHLKRLREDGAVRELPAAPGQNFSTVDHPTAHRARRGRGRPAIVWQAVPTVEREPYAGLAGALMSALLEKQPGERTAEAARVAGVQWGRQTVVGRSAAQHVAGEPDNREVAAVSLAFELVREQGFAPAHVTENPDEFELRRCPLLALARENPEVVCAVHEGMIEGAVNEFAETPDAQYRARLHSRFSAQSKGSGGERAACAVHLSLRSAAIREESQ